MKTSHILPLLVLAAAPVLVGTSSQERETVDFANLVGWTRAEVLAHCGSPATAGASQHSYQLGWDQGEQNHSLVFYDDTVAMVHTEDSVTQRTSESVEGVFLGQSASDMLRHLGAPQRIFHGQNSDVLEYADGTRINVAHDIVISAYRQTK